MQLAYRQTDPVMLACSSVEVRNDDDVFYVYWSEMVCHVSGLLLLSFSYVLMLCYRCSISHVSCGLLLS